MTVPSHELTRLRAQLFILRAAAGAALDALDDLLHRPWASAAEIQAVADRIAALRQSLDSLPPPSREDPLRAANATPVDPTPAHSRHPQRE